MLSVLQYSTTFLSLLSGQCDPSYPLVRSFSWTAWLIWPPFYLSSQCALLYQMPDLSDLCVCSSFSSAWPKGPPISVLIQHGVTWVLDFFWIFWPRIWSERSCSYSFMTAWRVVLEFVLSKQRWPVGLLFLIVLLSRLTDPSVLFFRSSWIVWSCCLFFNDSITQMTCLAVISEKRDLLPGSYKLTFYPMFFKDCVTDVAIPSCCFRLCDSSDCPVCCSFRTTWLK